MKSPPHQKIEIGGIIGRLGEAGISRSTAGRCARSKSVSGVSISYCSHAVLPPGDFALVNDNRIEAVLRQAIGGESAGDAFR